IFIIILLFLFVVPIISLICGFYLPKNIQGQERIFLIERGESVFQISQNLESQGFIESRYFFNLYIFVFQKQNKLQAGTYFLNPSMNIDEIVSRFASGDIAIQTITIPEGFTQKQIEDRLGLKLPGENIEGYLFPDTYHFPIGISAEDVVKIMRNNFDNKLTVDLREEIRRQKKTIADIVTIASLLEKEVKTLEDKEMVSGILWKRLSIGMPLQVDSAMETYKYRELPDSPICNPGLESIKAAIYPQSNPYLYYLSASDDGKTIFSKTLEEHNINRAKYLK
ncbi:endolytic transglycosylase MltG, partial [Patescibacteria group bacterium]|nr:endolytic transglycosylase MltG [Patescibacteria group bacterium]MBU1877254.1 endolytic transglycosylase MltG [Patescibacteria group bacterium]